MIYTGSIAQLARAQVSYKCMQLHWKLQSCWEILRSQVRALQGAILLLYPATFSSIAYRLSCTGEQCIARVLDSTTTLLRVF